ncbi:solute symporter family protein [Patulibacter defluvii]|uniref:solute symporter family protein n=1 Tax=Patulibacter defluvii TaxID=3095358 RepID=UPI002A758208|nr:sodium/solute symporter [Patulibacter sp. DM4]
MSLPLAETNGLALSIFAVVVAVTLAITWWASKRTTSTAQFWAAGRGISGVQNGFAIAGDYMSAASFLGIAGLIFFFGFDGFLYSVGFLVAFLTVLFLLAEKMRNAGKFTIADVLAFRLKQTPARSAAAIGTLTVAAFYLIAQMVGAGVLISALVGIDFQLAVLLTGLFMLCYVIFGGMLATTWVQIVKAVLLMVATTVLTVLVLIKIGGNPLHLFTDARDASPAGKDYLAPGLKFTNPIDTVSLGLGLVLGTAGLPHILMRFFTVPTAKAARTSVVWAIGLIGAFYLMTTALGFGARALLGGTPVEGTIDKAGNLAAPRLAEFIGGGAGTFGGDLFLAIIAAVAFATILAVVAGLVISASGAVAHDVWNGIVKKGRASEGEELWAGRIAAVAIGVIAIAIAVIGGEGLNVSFMVGLAFAVAASANFPALLLALTWKRFNTAGALTGVAFGVTSAIALIIVSPGVWPGPGGSPIGWELGNPGIVSIPLGFFGCWLGTVLSSDRSSEARFTELHVRSETGLGAEQAAAH